MTLYDRVNAHLQRWQGRLDAALGRHGLSRGLLRQTRDFAGLPGECLQAVISVDLLTQVLEWIEADARSDQAEPAPAPDERPGWYPGEREEIWISE